MNTKQTKRIALLCAAGLLFAAQVFTQDFPAYLKMDGTKITGCDKTALPANLMIPDGVTKIGTSAFEGCDSLTSVSIPTSVKKIDASAFGVCSNIKTVQYKGTLAQWCQMDNDGFFVENAKTITMSDVADLKAMTALTIPKGVTKIAHAAFSNCEKLMKVKIPNTVTEIGNGAFFNCVSLVSVTIPASVKNIREGAFAGCERLASVKISDGVTKIGERAFCECKSLASISIPASVTKIDSRAFDDCDNIKTVQYKGTLAQWCQMDNDGALVRNANTIIMSDVSDLKAMTALAIPNGVTRIGSYAFFECT